MFKKSSFVRIGKHKHQLAKPFSGMQPPLKFLAPTPQGWLIAAMRALAPWYIKTVAQISHSELENGSALVDALHDFYADKTRLVLAFRHPSTDDPQLLYKVTCYDAFKLAKAQGRPLPVRPHLHFLYDRGVPLWAGRYLEWILPRFGATPIYRSKADRQGFASARRLLAHGRHPFAVAPEGGTNNKNFAPGPLESGVVQLASWAQDDLKTKGVASPAVILPIGLVYSYPTRPWASLDDLLNRLESGFIAGTPQADTGHWQRLVEDEWQSQLGAIEDTALRQRYERYLAVYLALLETLEEHFKTYFKHEPAPKAAGTEARLLHLTEVLFNITEHRLAMRSHKEYPKLRAQVVEQAAWQRLFRPRPGGLVRQRLADWLARDTQTSLQYARLAEGLFGVSVHYLFENPSFERLVDTATSTWDALSYSLGLAYGQRPRVGPRQVCVSIGQPIQLAAPGEAKTERKDKKQALQQASLALEQEFARLVNSARGLPPGRPD